MPVSLKPFALLVRLPNSFTVLANVLAAMVIGSQANISWLTLTACALMSLAFYYSGMILNDCVDVDEDRQNQPHRPLVSGAVPLQLAWNLAIGFMTGGLLLASVLGKTTLLFGILLTLAIVTYDLLPRQQLFGCLVMGGCRMLNWLLILSVTDTHGVFWPYALLVGLYTTALTFVSRDEEYGARPWLLKWSAGTLLIGALVFIMSLNTKVDYYALKILIVVLGLSVCLHKLYRVYRDYQPATLRSALMFFIMGCLLYTSPSPRDS